MKPSLEEKIAESIKDGTIWIDLNDYYIESFGLSYSGKNPYKIYITSYKEIVDGSKDKIYKIITGDGNVFGPCRVSSCVMQQIKENNRILPSKYFYMITLTYVA